jgi:Dynamin family
MKRLPVQDTDGGTFQIQVSDSDTLFHVRSKLTTLRSEFLNSEHPSHFRLFYNGKQLTLDEERQMLAWSILPDDDDDDTTTPNIAPVIVLPAMRDPIIQEEELKRKASALSEDKSVFKKGDGVSYKKARVKENVPNSTTDASSKMAVSDDDDEEVLVVEADKAPDSGFIGSTLLQDDSTITTIDNENEGTDQRTALPPPPYSPPTLEAYHPKLFELHGPSIDKDGHKKIDKTHEQCLLLLQKAKEMINIPTLHRFCPPSHREEWNKEIDELCESKEPEITIGCLGGTGVGKSSLLKALLNEDNILPTSSSRGCTAAVVELKYNQDLIRSKGDVDVYKGNIEFISLQDWKDELELLIEDCCDDESGKVCSLKREESEEARASWSKIDAVYGKGTMKTHERSKKDLVFKVLSQDENILELLRNTNPGCKFNVVEVNEGRIKPHDVESLLLILRDPTNPTVDKKLARQKKKWSESFRKSINSYVYRRGRGEGPQTWPLIRNVVLRGPWHVLSTGACLVDLPGVRDDNAARAKVSEKYLQNCTKIWIFAPIKRAVDDKTAKDLLGEEFKRRLLMDGNYGNVSFICTHSDDCEISEIMHDHEDVAKEKDGRWEQMGALKEEIRLLAKNEDELADELEDVQDMLKECEEGLKHRGGGEGTVQGHSELKLRLLTVEKLMNEFPTEREARRRQCHQQLKILASQVRNEFSQKSLQNDFRDGIEELFAQAGHNNNEYQKGNGSSHVLPADFQLEVFCTSSNEYLKLKGVKAGVDGDAGCFQLTEETGVPDVERSVSSVTEKFRADHAVSFVKKTGNVLGRIYLYASECKTDATTIALLSEAFESEMGAMMPPAEAIAEEFGCQMKGTLQSDLEPHLKMAATRADKDSIAVVDDWFACPRRTRSDPKNRGIHWATFGAAARRGGVYKSATSGPLSLNQEICNPLEKGFCTSWNQVMVASLTDHLLDAKQKFLHLSNKHLDAIGAAFGEKGMDSVSIQWMKTHGMQGSDAAIDTVFSKIARVAFKRASKLNRSSVFKIKDKMKSTYGAVATVSGGTGKASRQETAMKSGGQRVLTLQTFDPMMSDLHRESMAFIDYLTKIMLITPHEIRKSLHQACCLGWNDENYMDAMKESRVLVEVFDSRNALLPNLVRLCAAHDNAMDYLGIPRDDATQPERVVSNEPKEYLDAKKKLM